MSEAAASGCSESSPESCDILPAMSDLRSILRRCGLFRGLDDAALSGLAESMAEERHRAVAVVIREGDAAEGMFVILEGAVQVFTADREGREVVVARLEAGEHFGEQALLPGSTGR